MTEDAARDRSPSPSRGPAEGTFDPPRLLRIAGLAREVLEEARRIQPEPSAVEHLRAVLERVCSELREALPPELFEELDELTPEVRDGTLQELTLAHAEILGWLSGLFQGTQLALQMQGLQAMQSQRGSLPSQGGSSPAPAGNDSQYL